MYANKLAIHNCPLCGSGRTEHLMDCIDHYATGEQFAIYICKDCGFRFTQDAPAESEIAPYYESPDYISHTDTRKGLMNHVYHWVRTYMLRRKANLVCRVSGFNAGRILDYGAGTGYFIHTMCKRGWQVDAIEKSPKAREFAKEHFDLELKDESALDAYAAQSFQVITLWHVMEHVERLDYLWQRIREMLDNAGTLIVAVPNCASYDESVYREYWAAYDVPRHLWHFTPDTMRRMGEKHGFSLMKQLPMPFDAFYVSMLSEKYKKNSSYFMAGFWTGLKAWFASCGKSGKSSSVIYVFKKK